MGAFKAIGNLIFILPFIVVFFYSAPAMPGDEPAPVVYIDPETGELRVQNPPKLAREHGTDSQIAADAGEDEQSDTIDSKLLYVFSGILIMGIIMVTAWVKIKKKSKPPSE